MKTEKHPCLKCGTAIKIPIPGRNTPADKAWRARQKAILSHAWEYHRQDLPPQFDSFEKFIKWLYTPEGHRWDSARGLMIEAERLTNNRNITTESHKEMN